MKQETRMKTPLLARLCLTMLPLFLGGTLWAQNIVQIDSPNLGVAEDQASADSNNVVIFSNLGSSPTDRYDSRTFAKLTVAGKSVIGVPETWQAKVLLAAITYVSGTKLVDLGLYSDNDGEVGTPIPGGQGSTTEIPNSGECCQLARVTLAGSGVTLSGGTRYWLVGSPDNVNGATFNGSWQTSIEGISAQFAPPAQWTTASGAWPAAEVRGAPITGWAKPNETAHGTTRPQRITIFSNLGPTPAERFYPAVGNYVSGKDSAIGAESWFAVPFIAKLDCHAKTLAAAIGYISGEMKVNLGLYSDEGGTVGTLLPNGQASTTNIPLYPTCCDLAEVALAGAGPALNAKTTYWLVASTDDVDAPSFEGLWRETTVYSNYQEPKFFSWTFVESRWFAAEIRGTSP